MNINRIINSLLVSVCLLMMSACSYYHHYHDRVVAKNACYQDCKVRQWQCAAVCDQDSKLCNAKAEAIAGVHFNHYRHQQCVKGEGMTLELDSFRDPLACLKMSCECKQDYRICVQLCQNDIYKRLQTVT